ncbi:MAG TPA: hypothetical protein ENK57_12140 [Polyangiaceae bacterium]|nr:hypothetical protein [Polyangiaceae bacterium]
MSEGEPSPRARIEDTVWDIVRNGYVRAASGGRIPRSQADRNELVRPFLSDMKQDHAALLACMDQGARLHYEAISAVAPERPDDDG